MITHSRLDFPKPSVPGSAAGWFWFSLVLGEGGGYKSSRGEYWINLKQSKIVHLCGQQSFITLLEPCSSRKV